MSPPPEVNGLDGIPHTSLSGNVGASQSTAQVVAEASIPVGVARQEASITEYSDSAMEVDDPNEAPQTQQATTSRVVGDNIVQRASSLPATLEPKYRFGYVYDDMMLLHNPQTEHPEMPERILQIFHKLQRGGVIKYMKRVPIRDARKYEVLLVHSEDHWEKVEAIKHMTKEDIVLSTSYYEHLSLYVCEKTTKAALLSCGGTIEAALAVARGELLRTFAIVRPPGHHAEPEEHMGFCFLNNVAVATRVVQQLTPIKRILILDWDVHHGNGTQRAFYDDPTVLYISLHRFEGGNFYPCGPFGGLDQCGVDEGLGMSVNVPWPSGGMTDGDYIHAFTKIVMPIAMEFAPELVMISAGFDAADGDDLGECHVTPGCYAHMTHMLSSLAGGKVVVALEGGYNVNSISNSSLAVAQVLIGDSPPEMPPLIASEEATETVWAVAMQQSKFWKTIDVKSCEPKEEYGEDVISFPELLKLHRQEYLYNTLKMVQVPLIPFLDERFNAQILCSENVLDKETLVLLVHQFGNLRVELTGALTCEPNQELSYLIDSTRQLVTWVESKGFSYVEVNTHPKPLSSDSHTVARSWKELGKELVTYLWDNYIQLSKAKNVIVIGHGPGCAAVMELLSQRTQNILRHAKAVCMIVGYSEVPEVPSGSRELREWYIDNSFVAVPTDHRMILEGRTKSKHGLVVQFDEPRPIKLLSRALPNMAVFIDGKLA